jgi:hypothetical protein
VEAVSRVERRESFRVRRGSEEDLVGFETGLEANRTCAE